MIRRLVEALTCPHCFSAFLRHAGTGGMSGEKCRDGKKSSAGTGNLPQSGWSGGIRQQKPLQEPGLATAEKWFEAKPSNSATI